MLKMLKKIIKSEQDGVVYEGYLYVIINTGELNQEQITSLLIENNMLYVNKGEGKLK